MPFGFTISNLKNGACVYLVSKIDKDQLIKKKFKFNPTREPASGGGSFTLPKTAVLKVGNTYIHNNITDFEKTVNTVLRSPKYGLTATELNIIKIATQNDIKNIVSYYAYYDESPHEHATCVLLERGSITMHDYFFVHSEQLGNVLNPEHCTDFALSKKNLKIFCDAIDNILDFLKSISIVYCDWRFDNFLIFFSDSSKLDYTLKLVDFGASITANLECINKKNKNEYYCSPNLSSQNAKIVPTFVDDHISCCYMLATLNGIILPWHLISPDTKNMCRKKYELVMERCIHLINTHKLYNPLNIEQCVYWPAKTSCWARDVNMACI